MIRQFAVLACCFSLLGPFSIPSAQAQSLQVEEVVSKLENPWGFDFLPNGAIVITEREGTLRMFQDGQLSAPLAGLPSIATGGQGGLLDVLVSRDFAQNQTIFFTFSEAGTSRGKHTAVARARLVENRLEDVQVIFRQYPSLSGGRHFGSRLIQMEDGTLMITLGDRGERDMVQDPSNLIGKVVRINPDGSIPADNPFVGRAGYAPEIYSIGHRNPQGAAVDGQGRYWTVSHGARGGDEINRPLAGRNYGWPIISYGTHYSGFKIGEGTRKDGMEQPLYYWDPSIAPSGMAFYDGGLFPQWQGDIFVGALRGQALVRVDVENGEIVGTEQRLFEDDLGRIRAVKIGPKGAIWVATDEDPGGLFRITPQ